MELILLSIFCCLVTLFISLPLLLFLITRNNRTHSSLKYPPGRMGWPIIGESLKFGSCGLRGVPEKFTLERMQKFSSKIFKTSLLGEKVAVVCGPAGNKFVFSNENKLVRLWFPSSVDKIFPYSKHTSSHTETLILRKLLPGFINADALKRYAGIIDSTAKHHLQSHWANNKEVIAYPLVKKFVFSVACKLFLSIDDPVQVAELSDPFAVLGAGIFSIPINLPGTALNKAIKASNGLRTKFQEIITQRKLDLIKKRSSSQPQDILSHMLSACDEHGQFLDESSILSKTIGLLLGSLDTLSSAITFAIKYLAEHPHFYTEVLREQKAILNSKNGETLKWEDIQKMKYSWNVASEVMRLTPPFQGTFREAITDINYEGFLIPQGWKVHWNVYSTHKDAKYFPDPDKFDPSRFDGNGPAPYTYVPFGGGPRMCPGNEYARVVILTFIHNIVTKFKWETILPYEKIIANPMPKPAKGLPIRLQTQCS
ncbi:hypothetical protein AQUCO_01100594v1 [Aquilegia coerulea]|uniref:Cytochrome P450 n=1 Tax=Aquilegia coerulea TaxID=218851 RepID=A0A1I9Q5Z6_AQUCA|nr:cytochrome P450 [Aquilegia coerulea]PIA51818.1 hypothetical protein AQUCO_01100594v1 [Aquilegia coerulea]